MLKYLPWGTALLTLDYELLDDITLRLKSIIAKDKSYGQEG